MKDQNYYSAFIEVADDCPVSMAQIPPQKGNVKSAPVLQYEMIRNHPYKYTQEDVLFGVYASRNGVDQKGMEKARKQFFSKGQPCLRCSPLGKRYGWGIHCDARGRVAIYAMETEEYRRLAADITIRHLKAMRTSRSGRGGGV